MLLKKIFAFVLLLMVAYLLPAQTLVVDSAGIVKKNTSADSIKAFAKKAPYDSTFSPRKATIRSAMIPGWGQIYNKQIWKVPLVYAAVGISAGVFFYNIKDYRGLRDAYRYVVDTDTSNDKLIDARYRGLIPYPNTLKSYRDEVRKNVDRSVLVFILAWALNVVDATVAAHLKQFDVSDDLSMDFKPSFQLNGQMGVGVVFRFKDKKSTATR